MNMSDTNVSDVLNHCLELLDQGLTVEDCLRRYPALSEELAPLLQLAMQTQTAAETIGPSPEAQRAGLGRITDAWTAMQERQRRRERGPWRLLRRSWVLAAVAAMVLAFGGWTTAAAAQDSVPGEMLYPVKEARERVLLLVVFSDSRKANLHAGFAEARAAECAKLASRGGDIDTLNRTAERIEVHTREAVALMGGQLSDGTTVSEGVIHVVGRGGRGYRLSRDTRIHGELSVGRVQLWTDPETGQRRPWYDEASKRRFLMQKRFREQFRHMRELREGLPIELHPERRRHFSASFERAEVLLQEAFLLMRALEDAYHPPE